VDRRANSGATERDFHRVREGAASRRDGRSGNYCRNIVDGKSSRSDLACRITALEGLSFNRDVAANRKRTAVDRRTAGRIGSVRGVLDDCTVSGASQRYSNIAGKRATIWRNRRRRYRRS